MSQVQTGKGKRWEEVLMSCCLAQRFPAKLDQAIRFLHTVSMWIHVAYFFFLNRGATHQGEIS